MLSDIILGIVNILSTIFVIVAPVVTDLNKTVVLYVI
jgi:hypothetical protein